MQALCYCCIYFENLRIKAQFSQFPVISMPCSSGTISQKEKQKMRILCLNHVSFLHLLWNGDFEWFLSQNGNKLMHYANNTHEIPFLTHSDASCGGFRKLRLQENYIWKQPESCDASTSLAESSYQRRSAAQWEYAKATRRWQHWHPLPDSCMLWWIYPRELDWIEENYIGKGAVKKSPALLESPYSDARKRRLNRGQEHGCSVSKKIGWNTWRTASTRVQWRFLRNKIITWSTASAITLRHRKRQSRVKIKYRFLKDWKQNSRFWFRTQEKRIRKRKTSAICRKQFGGWDDVMSIIPYLVFYFET